MEVKNYGLDDSQSDPKHHFLLPNCIRCIIVGPSGCGKTNLLVNMLLKHGWLNYDRIHIYSKSLEQDNYTALQDWAKNLDAAASTVGINKSGMITFHKDSDTIIPVEKLDPKETTVLVFDDVMLEKQRPIELYFTRGRHRNANCFYLAQNYFKIPNQTIRDNANMLILFRQPKPTLRIIYDKFVSCDMNFEEFFQFFTDCTSEDYGFCTIDLTSKPYDGRYRKNLDTFYIPHNYAV